MNKSISKILVAIIILLSTTAVAFGQTKEPKSQNIQFCCPMHPKECSKKQDKCAECGMKMVKIATVKYNSATKGSQSKTKIGTKYICKMDETISNKAGKCSKCGMELVKKEE